MKSIPKKYQDLTGKKYGKITVVERAGSFISLNKKTGKKTCRAKWKCVCDCGTQVIKNSNELYRGKYTKCKPCSYAERPQSTKRHTALERLFRLKVIGNCSNREIKVNMSAEEYYNIAKNNCYYCDEPPKEFELYKGKYSKKESLMVNGVDRIDSDGNYEVSNCVPCCFNCNSAKRIMTQEEFFSLVKRIYDKHVKDKK
jgi:hypothetical protein